MFKKLIFILIANVFKIIMKLGQWGWKCKNRVMLSWNITSPWLRKDGILCIGKYCLCQSFKAYLFRNLTIYKSSLRFTWICRWFGQFRKSFYFFVSMFLPKKNRNVCQSSKHIVSIFTSMAVISETPTTHSSFASVWLDSVQTFIMTQQTKLIIYSRQINSNIKHRIYGYQLYYPCV